MIKRKHDAENQRDMEMKEVFDSVPDLKKN